ncbi:MAG: hypothetical protein HY453_01520 [Parcubacteria group bacterium]|nr:hypothetical protein [Parcubacteria group bacterium]
MWKTLLELLDKNFPSSFRSQALEIFFYASVFSYALFFLLELLFDKMVTSYISLNGLLGGVFVLGILHAWTVKKIARDASVVAKPTSERILKTASQRMKRLECINKYVKLILFFLSTFVIFFAVGYPVFASQTWLFAAWISGTLVSTLINHDHDQS